MADLEAQATQPSSDPVFAEEQAHLSDIYGQLMEIRDELNNKFQTTHKTAVQDLKDMSEEVTTDFGGEDETMETLAAIETLNSVIDSYNQEHDFDAERLRKVLVLLNQPYFAKVRLRMRPGRPARDVYIGVTGMTDKDRRPLIVDWRSPIAETYYNQEVGPTTYEVDGRVRHVDLELRRQFDITRDRLNTYFDTTVAIEDSLLLSALRRHHSEKLQAITATIQREQNEVVRHADVPVLLVNGIAGSGKTSVLLQRIAYLFYQERESLRADQIYLFSPNDVFETYIDTVLPSLGESNPNILTWRQFLAKAGLGDHNPGFDTMPETLRLLEREVGGDFELDQQDFRDIRIEGMRLVNASQVAAAYRRYPRVPMGPRRSNLVKEDLHDALERKIAQLAKTDEVQEDMLGLDVEEQVEIFGETINPVDDEETTRLARTYVDHLYGPAHDMIDAADWLRTDRIGMRLLGRQPNALEWLYLRLLITGDGAEGARYVMVDECQDYTQAQYMVMARYFGHAHFLLLGDEHQAIYDGTASFAEMREVFAATHGQVDECRLLTSYRSSPEITALFTSLLAPDERVRLSSVREAGVAPEIVACPEDADAYLAELRRVVGEAAGEEGLTAVVADNKGRVSWLAKQLGDAVAVVEKGGRLPAKGVVLMELSLAKGLEFDHVVVPDAQASVYPDTQLARRRLYTAVSRAMHKVTLLSQGEMSPLLDGARRG